MSKFAASFVARIAGVATLALAVVPVAALTTTAAHANPAPVHVRVADLDFGSVAGRAEFEARVYSAGRQMCRDERSLRARSSCQAGVRAEAHEKLASYIHFAAR